MRNAVQKFWDPDEAPGWFGRLISRLLTPISFVYCGVQKARRILYRRGILRSRKLLPRVISIGGLHVGGSGKTPFAAWLAQRLQAKGYQVAVLTRGYGRKGSGGTRVLTDADRTGWDPDLFGDEPCMLAASLRNVPVVVDSNRYRGGMNLLRESPVDIFLLDDGFQHLALSRDCNIVLVPEGEDPAGMACLPRGPLREQVSALQDADIVVRFGGTPDRRSAQPEGTAPDGHRRFGFVEFAAGMEPGGVRLIEESEARDPGCVEREGIFAFCGIARPHAFWKSLERLGWKIGEHRAYPDHHRYTKRDHQELLGCMNRFQHAVTTEKDAVKLCRFSWPPGKLLVLGVRPALSDEPGFWNVLEAKLASRGK